MSTQSIGGMVNDMGKLKYLSQWHLVQKKYQMDGTKIKPGPLQ